MNTTELTRAHAVGHEICSRALGFSPTVVGSLDKGAAELLREYPGRGEDLAAVALAGVAGELIRNGARTPGDAAKRWAADIALCRDLLRRAGREEEGLETYLGRAGRLLYDRRAELRRNTEDRGDELKRRAAHHEAGHALVAHRLGLPVTRVHVDGQGGGECDHRPEGATFDDLATVSLAGPAAEVLAFGKHSPSSDRWKPDQDFVTELGQLAGWKPTDFTACIDRAAKLVKEARSDIAWVARCLRRQGTLEGADLDRVLNGAPRPVSKSAPTGKHRGAPPRRRPLLFLLRTQP